MWAYTLVAPATFECVEITEPRSEDLGEGQVVLRTLAGGICGSDLPLFMGRRSWLWQNSAGGVWTAPGFPMHEVAGEVVATRHPALAVGEHVVGWASGCDAIAEFVVCAGDELTPYDPDLRPEIAVLLQPLACVLFAVDQIANIEGARAAVIGLGPIGLLFTHALKARGATTVVGVDRVDRSEEAKIFGVDEFVHLTSDTWVSGLADADRPNIIVEAVGHQVSTLTDIITAAAPFGQIHYFGLPDDASYPFPMMAFLRKNLTLVSGVTQQRALALAQASAYLAEHPDLAREYVTDVYPVADVQRAFEAGVDPKPGQLKVAITMG